MAGPIGLQQLLRMQGIEWGDSAQGDKHLWFDGGALYTDAGLTTLNTFAQTYTLPVGYGATAWNNAITTLPDNVTTAGSPVGVQNTLNIGPLTVDYSGTISALGAQTNTGTGAANFTGKVRAGLFVVNVQTSGGTITRIEANTGLTQPTVGSVGTITSGYGTSGELLHLSNSLTVTTYEGLFGSLQTLGSGNFGTGYGAYCECLTDGALTGATGTFTSSATGVHGAVTHQNVSALPVAIGARGVVTNSGGGTITTDNALYSGTVVSGASVITSAVGLSINVSTANTGSIGTWQGIIVVNPTLSAGASSPITTARGIRVNNQGATGVTTAYGVVIDATTGASGLNVNLLLGSAAPGVGSWSLYSTSTALNWFGGSVIQSHTTAAINSTAAATAAQAATGYITSTSAAPTTITLPTGTALGAVLNAAQGTIHDLYIDNTAGASTVTIAVNTNAILSADAAANAASAGLLTVPNGVTGQACFRLMFSSATAYTFTRIA